jgi:hypothetical protein
MAEMEWTYEELDQAISILSILGHANVQHPDHPTTRWTPEACAVFAKAAATKRYLTDD